MLEDFTLVVAHPDDEILWFSSVLEHADAVHVCYLQVVSKPEWTRGREQSLAQYPLRNIGTLGLTEGEAFRGVDWENPVPTDYGLALTRGRRPDHRYRANYDLLVAKLRERLASCRRVITHNPWGEYGHPEHVQVYRAVMALRAELGFEVWVGNYASNKSMPLMLSSRRLLAHPGITLATNPQLAEEIGEIYQENGCWTWFPDFQWADSESFFEVSETGAEEPELGGILPLNVVSVAPPRKPRHNYSKGRRFLDRLKRVAARGLKRTARRPT